MLNLGLLGKAKWFTSAVKATKAFKALKFIGTIAFWTTGVKGFLQMREMLNQGQAIMANKRAAGGKIPVIYGTRRVGTQIVYLNTFGNENRDLYVVYALSVGECEEIVGKSIEIDGNSILDSKIFKKGGYIGSDKITSGAGSLCTADQNGDTNAGTGGTIGTDPTKRYQFVFNLHHGAASQTADPMLTASIPSDWTSDHKLNGICYIAAHFHYSKTGVFQGIPNITVQVKGKKVYDPRESGHTFGDASTYEWSSNPALCYLDYITNDEYGKGLAEADINMSTFESAADACDVLVDQPYYNGAYQNITWSGTSGDDFVLIGSNTDWYQNKTDEVVDIRDNGGTNIFSGTGIKGVQRHQFYDDSQVNKVFIDGTLSSDYTNEAGSFRAKVKRFHCNGLIDTNRNVMDNAKELLANMRGIFTYIDGKYELQIEDTGSSTFSITEDHIIADEGISVDYGNKDKKANKVVIEFYNSQLNYELDTATVLHDATPNYYSDDGEILEIKAQFPLVTDAYIAYNMGKAILTRSRNQISLQFLGTPEMYKLNVGDIVDVTYAGLGFSGKICRVESLELQSNGLVNVSLIEYFDVYTWEVPAEEDTRKLTKLPTKGAIKPPEASSIVFTDTDASAINRPTLTWTEPDDFDVKEFRVDVVDSSDNNVFSKIVDTPSVDLSFLPKASNYEASITAFNTLDVESEPVTKTFTIADDPVKTTEVEIGSETLSNIIDYGTVTGQSGNWFQINGRLDLEDRFIWNSNGDNYWALGTAGDDDVNLKIEGGANTLIQFKDQDNALGTVKLAFGDDVGGDYSHDFIHIVADYTQGNHATDAKSIFYIKGRANDGSSASGDIAKFTFGAADGYGFPSSVLYGTTTTPILIAEDYIEIEQATAPSTTTDKLYNVSGTLYWNGGAVNTGAGDITSVTINTAGGGLTGGASFSSGDATFTLAIGTNIQGDKTFDDNVVIEGDLTVQGTTTTIDTTNLDVKDKNITLNYGTGDTSANADGAGITIQDAVSSTEDATILWTTANDTFNFSHPVSVNGNITSSNTVTSQSINVSSSGYGTIEVGGVTGAYIDLKRPNTDDYDLRLITDGTGGVIDTGSGELTLKRQGSTKITTTSSGIDVTGTVTADGLTIDGNAVVNNATNATLQLQATGGNAYQVRTDINDVFIYNATAARPLVKFAYGGDISFYEDTGTTAKLFWDASAERLGLGTTSADGKVHIESSSSGATAAAGGDELVLESSATTGLSILSGTANDGNILFGDSGNSAIGYVQYKHADNALAFGANGGEVARFDSSGNIGIGITPSAWGSTFTGLQVSSSVLYNNNDNDTFLGANYFYDGSNNKYINSSYATAYGQVDGQHIWYTASSGTAGNTVSFSERMRIDTSGNLLLHTTNNSLWNSSSNTSADTGQNINTVYSAFSRHDGQAVYMNRTGSDGTILQFNKSGSPVGSIGSTSGVVTHIVLDPRSSLKGAGIVGGSIDASEGIINPVDRTGAIADGAINLGGSSSRWKNLYLSGSAKLVADSSASAEIQLKQTGVGGRDYRILSSGSGYGSVGSLVFYDATASSERARIDSSGNLLIGTTTNPNSRKFRVYGISEFDGAGVSLQVFNSSGTKIGSAGQGNYVVSGGPSTGFGIQSQSELVFGSNGTSERMRIDSSGNVGIGGSTTTGWANKQVVLDAGSNTSAAFVMVNDTTGRTGTDGSVITLSGSDMYLIQRESANMIFRTANTERMRIDSSGNVGIGITPSARLHSAVGAAGSGTLAQAMFGYLGGSTHYLDANTIIFRNGYASEKMRIDSSGNLLVGTTNSGLISATTSTGINLNPNGASVFVRSGGSPLYLNRLTSDGVMTQYRRNGTTKGQIGILDSIATSTVYFASGSSSSTGTGLKFVAAVGTNSVLPCRGDGTGADNLIDLGSSGTRFDDIYATNGTIQTSDRNEKQDIQELSEAEQRVAVACKGLIRRYKFNSAVAEKGDDARYHFGIIAQDLQDAFTAEGLDAGDYGMFISETWTDEEGNEQTKLGVRYNELLAFIIATL